MTLEGKFQSINFNILVRYIVEKRKIVLDEGGVHYWYSKKSNVWVKTDASKICRLFHNYIHKEVPNIWQSHYSHEVKEALFFDAKRTSSLKKAKCPNFDDFIAKLTLKDTELKVVIQKIMGYVLTRRVDAQKFFIFFCYRNVT